MEEKKQQKENKGLVPFFIVIIAVLVIAVIACILFFSGVFSHKQSSSRSTAPEFTEYDDTDPLEDIFNLAIEQQQRRSEVEYDLRTQTITDTYLISNDYVRTVTFEIPYQTLTDQDEYVSVKSLKCKYADESYLVPTVEITYSTDGHSVKAVLNQTGYFPKVQDESETLNNVLIADGSSVTKRFTVNPGKYELKLTDSEYDNSLLFSEFTHNTKTNVEVNIIWDLNQLY